MPRSPSSSTPAPRTSPAPPGTLTTGLRRTTPTRGTPVRRRGDAVSLHADATDVLKRWEPPDAGQAGLRDLYLAHLGRHGDGVWRECRPDHVTASALVLSTD